MTNKIILPKANWNSLINILVQLKLGNEHFAHAQDAGFLQQLGYIADDGSLNSKGLNLCILLLVRRDNEAVKQITHNDLILLPVTQVLMQALHGLKDITVDQVKMALIFAGADKDEVNSRIINFLDVLNANDILIYSRKNRSINLLVSPKDIPLAPPHIYIDRLRPYSNDMRIREILRECRGTIMWLDKYFQKEAFEWLWREVKATKVTSIKIVSITSITGVDKLALADYKKLKKEFAPKGIVLEWKVLKPSESYGFHDRWVLDDDALCYNLPSVGSIRSGQKSEMHKSPNHQQVKQTFEEYFKAAQDII